MVSKLDRSKRTKKEKQCKDCKRTLHITNFARLTSKNKNGTYRRDCRCKPCRKQWRIERYEKQKEYYKERGIIHGRKNAAWFLKLKSKLKCIRCGFSHHAALVFHHRDLTTKIDTVSSLVPRSRIAALKEIKKCDVLCANCHMILHYEERLNDIY